MLSLVFAAACAGIFCGASLYVNIVEHPARMSCGTDFAVREFAPSYKRAAVMQAALALAGSLFGLAAAWRLRDTIVALGAVSLGAVIPFTLVVILPINRRLLDLGLDRNAPPARALLERWNKLHAVRSVLSAVAFALFLLRLALHPSG
jgi:Domain of unknown function (DUF1772)